MAANESKQKPQQRENATIRRVRPPLLHHPSNGGPPSAPTAKANKKAGITEITSRMCVDLKLNLSSAESKALLFVDCLITSDFQGHVHRPAMAHRKPEGSRDGGACFSANGVCIGARIRKPSDKNSSPALPKGVIILIRCWTRHSVHGEDSTGKERTISCVYTLLCLGALFLEDFIRGDSMDMRHVDTFNSIGTLCLRIPPGLNPKLPAIDEKAGDLTTRFAVPFYSLLGKSNYDLQPAFADYVTQTAEIVAPIDKGKACYPNCEKRWRWKTDHFKVTAHLFGDIPTALFLLNRSQTAINQHEVSGYVTNMLFHVLIEEGYTTDEYKRIAASASPDAARKLLMIASRLMRQVARRLNFSEDRWGESWTMPLSEHSLRHASMDCEELGVICGYMMRLILACGGSDEWIGPIALILKENYTGLTVLCLARIGPSDDSRATHSQQWMHIAYGLMHKDLFKEMRSPSSKRVGEFKSELPGFVLIEGVDDTQASPFLKRGRAKADYREIDALDGPHARTLGAYITCEAENKFHYYGDVVGFYRTDDAEAKAGSVLEYFPVTDGALGIAMSDLVNGEIGPSHRLIPGPPISDKALALAATFGSIYNNTTNVGFDAKHAARYGYKVLSASITDSMVAELKDARRVTFAPFDDCYTGNRLSQKERVEAAVASVRAYGKAKKLPEFSRITAKVVEPVLFYSGRGLPPTSCIAVSREPEQQTEAEQKIATGGKGKASRHGRVQPLQRPGAAAHLRIAGAVRAQQQRKQQSQPRAPRGRDRDQTRVLE